MNNKFPPAPLGMIPTQKIVWDSITRSFPADWFKESDLPLLAELCRAISTASVLGDRIENTHDTDELSKLLSLRDRESRRSAALSRTLRLPPQSRYDRMASATAARGVGKTWGENEFDQF